jgi:hypothetical protein
MERVLQTWRDICLAVLPNGATFETQVYSSCPPRTVCTSTFDDDGDPTIQCEPIQPPGKKQDPVPAEKKPQIGSSDVVTAITALSSSQFDIPVTIAADMYATVTAVVLSEFLLPSLYINLADNIT